MARFDEIELQSTPFELVEAPPVESAGVVRASRSRRLLALLTDVSLFIALGLALSPLLPPSRNAVSIGALVAFVVLISFYYFVGSWLLWGKTIGGTIFDVKVIAIGATAMPFKRATQRWAALYVSIASAGIGFAFALPDRMSATCCVSSS
jgi:hypothetical protein